MKEFSSYFVVASLARKRCDVRHSTTLWEFHFHVVNKLLGTLRNYDRDGNENVKKAIGLKSKQQHCACITLFCTFLCSPCITTTWNDQILSYLGNGDGKAINSTISVRTWARSLLFSSNLNSLLLDSWAPSNNRKKSERMRSLFFSDVFMDVAVVRSYGPYCWFARDVMATMLVVC